MREAGSWLLAEHGGIATSTGKTEKKDRRVIFFSVSRTVGSLRTLVLTIPLPSEPFIFTGSILL